MKWQAKRLMRVGLQAYTNFNRHQGLDQAAAIAFYSLLSLIPMYFLAVVLMGEILGNRSVALHLAAHQLRGLLPWVNESLMGRIRRMIWAMPSMGWFSLLAIIWTAGMFFSTIRRNLLLPWAKHRKARPGGMWPSMCFWLVTPGLSVVMILVLAATALLCALPEIILSRAELRSWGVLLTVWRLLWPWIFEFLIYLILLPGVRPIRLTLTVSGGLALAGWGLTTLCGEVLAKLPDQALIYGPLGGTVLLLLWLNYNAVLLVYGGHVIRLWRMGPPSPSGREGDGIGVRRDEAIPAGWGR